VSRYTVGQRDCRENILRAQRSCSNSGFILAELIWRWGSYCCCFPTIHTTCQASVLFVTISNFCKLFSVFLKACTFMYR
jgi:hypothetical protein